MTTHTDIDPILVEEFRQAFRDLLAQGHYGYNPELKACQYETEAGHHCVFGLYIKRKYPHIDLFRLHGTAYDVLSDVLPGPFRKGLGELARACQQTHDRAATSNSPLTLDDLKRVALGLHDIERDLAMYVLEGL